MSLEFHKEIVRKATDMDTYTWLALNQSKTRPALAALTFVDISGALAGAPRFYRAICCTTTTSCRELVRLHLC